MELTERAEDAAHAMFCHRCGSAPDVTLKADLVYPKTRWGSVLYRFPCTGRPECAGFVDLEHADLQRIAEQASASRFGILLKAIDSCRERLTADLDEAAEAKDRIAAARELRKLSERQLEMGRVIEPKQMAVSAPEIRVISGSIVERKLRARAVAAITGAVRAEAMIEQAAAVPEPVVDKEVVL